jgi:hypothetical protein
MLSNLSGRPELLAPRHRVQFVLPPDGRPPYAYTAGLADRPGRAYELAVIGVLYRLAVHVVNKAAEQLVDDGADPADGMELDAVLPGYLVRLHRAQDTRRFLGVSPDTPFWQVLTPDKWGCFPGDEHYIEQPAAYAQPLL